MIFPSADCPFRRVGSVQVGRHELKRNFVFVHNLYEVCRAFVVEDLKLWFESTIGKVFIYRLMCSCYFGSSSIFLRFCEDGVGVHAIRYEDVFVPQR